MNHKIVFKNELQHSIQISNSLKQRFSDFKWCLVHVFLKVLF